MMSHVDRNVVRHTQEDWDRFFMDLARRTALMSKDPDRKVGAVLASDDRRQFSLGYNGFPSGTLDSLGNLYDKQFKLAHMVHAEENCLRQAPFESFGSTLYVTRFPCLRCAQFILSFEVKRVVAPRPDFGHLRWGDSWMRSQGEMQRAGVEITYMEVE
jgi:dCMP deaminase